MRPFEYVRAASVHEALQAHAASSDAAFLAGGTTLVDLMKEGVAAPATLVDISRISGLDGIEATDGRLRVGALVRNSALPRHPEVVRAAPMLAQAAAAGASPQLRNMATVGGNLLQRTRCSYFRNPGFACNKRAPGAGCAATGGHDRGHAVLGANEHCIATHPSDMAVALVALGGAVRALRPGGERAIEIEAFFREPGATPWLETELQPGELITGIDVALPGAARRSVYVKVRDRTSYEFALASAAIGLEQEGARILGARVALGGIATRPWRCEAAERALVGRDAGPTAFGEAAEAALAGATPGRENGFKVELARRTLVRALTLAGRLPG